MLEMVGRPTQGRVFAGARRVRLGDCSPGGRLRLDAVARYLQDVSDDDTRDAGLDQMTWVVRRTVLDVERFPTLLEPLEMVTWCSGVGSRWAERRVDVTASGDADPAVRAATLWIHLDRDSLRPAKLTDVFADIFVPSSDGRSVSSRLELDGPPDDACTAPWPLRFADFDVMDHMNNAIAFAAVEEVLARHRDLRAPMRVEVEYRSPIDRGMDVRLAGVDGANAQEGWLVDDTRCHVAFRIRSKE